MAIQSSDGKAGTQTSVWWWILVGGQPVWARGEYWRSLEAGAGLIPAGPSKMLELLAGLAPGMWVILDPSMSTILSTAQTPEEAIEKARIPPPTSDRAVGERPVMFQVPDPTMAYF